MAQVNLNSILSIPRVILSTEVGITTEHYCVWLENKTK